LSGALDDLGSNSVRNSSKGRLSRKKLVSLMVMASAMARSSAGFFSAQVLHQFFQVRHALVAQQLGEARVEEIVARGVEHVLREAEDQLAKIAVVDAGAEFP
jgi:hypothetical protein